MNYNVIQPNVMGGIWQAQGGEINFHNSSHLSAKLLFVSFYSQNTITDFFWQHNHANVTHFAPYIKLNHITGTVV